MSGIKKATRTRTRVGQPKKESLVENLTYGETMKVDSVAKLLIELSHPMRHVYEWFPLIGKVYKGGKLPLDVELTQGETITFESLLVAVKKYREEYKDQDSDGEEAQDDKFFDHLNSEILFEFLQLFDTYKHNPKDLMIIMNVVNHQIRLDDKIREDNTFNDIIFLRYRYKSDDNVDVYIIRQMMKFMENKVTLEECTEENRSYFFEGIKVAKMYDYEVHELIWGS